MTRETGLPPNCDGNPDITDTLFAFVLGFAWLSPIYALQVEPGIHFSLLRMVNIGFRAIRGELRTAWK